MRKDYIINKHSSIFIGVVLFCILLYIECFYSYVNINVNDKTKMNQNNSVVITDTEQNVKFKTHIKLKSNQSGYGLYHINIPLQYEGKKQKIVIRYMKYNSWIKTKIKIDLYRLKKNNKNYIRIQIFLNEEGRFERGKNKIEKIIPMNHKNYIIDS
ncbi:MAG: hypothetical protein PHD70_00410 [Anaerostipes sp.]|nr:hypothetical protein [Anaerostipes sp.]